MLTAYGVTNIGPVRRTNEDSYASDDQLQLMVVADGMGGHLAGEVASSVAVETITGFIRRSGEPDQCSWPYGIDPAFSFASNRLRTAMHLANRRVFRAAEKYDEYTGMGTTAVCALITDHRLAVAHAGDSRLYLFAGGRLGLVTTDDTWEAAVPAHLTDSASMRHVLTNVLGARETADIHLQELELQGGELILLCSDGLHGPLDDQAISGILQDADPLDQVGPRLLEAALSRGGRDNVTVVLGRFDA